MLPLGDSIMILNRDLRVENGLFISIISFLDGRLRQYLLFTLCRPYDIESACCGSFQAKGYWDHSMNWVFHRYLIEKNIYSGRKTSRFGIILTSKWKIDLRINVIKRATLSLIIRYSASSILSVFISEHTAACIGPFSVTESYLNAIWG